MSRLREDAIAAIGGLGLLCLGIAGFWCVTHDEPAAQQVKKPATNHSNPWQFRPYWMTMPRDSLAEWHTPAREFMGHAIPSQTRMVSVHAVYVTGVDVNGFNIVNKIADYAGNIAEGSWMIKANQDGSTEVVVVQGNG